MSVEKNIQEIQKRIANSCERAGRPVNDITVIAVTKTVDIPYIETAYKAGIKHFGESRIQEAIPKIERLENLRHDLTWHMIGHLQTNKAKTAANVFDIIHSVDSIRLAQILSEHSPRKLSILVQVNIAGETSKSGFPLLEVDEAIKQIGELPNLEILGLMTIAPWVSDAEDVRPIFRQLREMRDAIGLKHLSMGMTADFEVAIEEGATYIRIGHAIFGERTY